jgi:hypothetical protein
MPKPTIAPEMLCDLANIASTVSALLESTEEDYGPTFQAGLEKIGALADSCSAHLGAKPLHGDFVAWTRLNSTRGELTE